MAWNIDLPTAAWYYPGDPRLEALVEEVLNEDVVAIDTETTGLVIHKDVVLYWSMAWGEQRVCMPMATLPFFRQVFSDSTKRWVLANAKFDAHMLANTGIHIQGELVDVSVMHALLYEEESHALKDMAKSVLGWRWADFFDTFPPQMVPDDTVQPKMLKSGHVNTPKRKETIQEVLQRCERDNLDKLVEYAANDAYGTLKLYERLKQELENTPIYGLYPERYKTMADLFFKDEVPFTRVLWTCERNGIHVSRTYLNAIEPQIRIRIGELERRIMFLASEEEMHDFNPRSVQQLQKYFLEKKKLRPLGFTKGGKTGVKQPSIDIAFLEYYADECEMAKLLVDHRDLSKTLGTYVEGLQERLDANERIHTRFNQDTARTGRLSSSDPNLQNITKAEIDEFKLRGAFQACPGNKLIVVDYEQLEMRLLACATVTDEHPEGAKEMIQIFLDGRDIHMGNAVMVFAPIIKREEGWDLTYEFLKEAKKLDGQVKEGKLPPEVLTPQHRTALRKRNDIKAIGFGLNYGMKENKLARALGITKEEAKKLIEAYLSTYPVVSAFYATAIEETRQTGYSFSVLGRRRFHPGIHSDNAMDRWSEERKAVNLSIQGSAADVVRLAMLKISSARLDLKYGCHMLLQIHDELVFECREETTEAAMVEIKEMMEHPFLTDLAVPLTVSIGSGHSWLEAK